MAEAAHEDQVRLSGEPFIEHPVAVTQILAELRLDTTTLDGGAPARHGRGHRRLGRQRSIRTFGDDVARIVDGLTKLDRLQFKTRELAQAENVRKMIVAMAGDIRVLLIKLADRLHNMRTLEALPSHKQHRIATETLEIYAPLANRLGVQEVKWELEDLAFKTLHPGPYKEIAQPRRDPSRGADEGDRRAHDDAASEAEGARDQGRRRRPPEAPVLDLREDGDPRQGVRGDPRPRRDPRPGRVVARLLRRARGGPRHLEAGPRPVQGLHGDAQGEHVPVAAHDGARSHRSPDRDPGADARHAPHRAVRDRGALAVQGGRQAAGAATSRGSAR